MAGSFSHIDDNGEFRMDLIENMGDAHEALEECHHMILRLRAEVDRLPRANKQRLHRKATEYRNQRDEALAKIKRLECRFRGLIGPLEHNANGCCS